MRKVVEVRNVVKRFGDVTAVYDLSFDVTQGQCVSLLGPSGCGKTTTLRIIAGFEKLDHGSVFIDGQDMAEKRPYERNIGLVFQDYALFPHTTVEQNIAFGMRHRGIDPREMPDRKKEILEQVKLSGYERRRPSQLSGGEQQRVALARALATRPAVMLLDEPMSNLDAKLREQVRIELKEILDSVGTTTIIVTHDQQEAMSLSDDVMVMNEGRIIQKGTPAEIYSRPQSKFVAEFIGRTNWFRGKVVAAAAPGLWACETTEGPQVYCVIEGAKPGDTCDIGVRPEQITVERFAGPGDGANPAVDNVLQGVIATIVYLGADIHLWIRLASGQQILAVEKNASQAVDDEGAPVTVRFSPGSCIVLKADAPGIGDRQSRPSGEPGSVPFAH